MIYLILHLQCLTNGNKLYTTFTKFWLERNALIIMAKEITILQGLAEKLNFNKRKNIFKSLNNPGILKTLVFMEFLKLLKKISFKI